MLSEQHSASTCLFEQIFSSAVPAEGRQPHFCHEGVAVFKAAQQALIAALWQAQAALLYFQQE